MTTSELISYIKKQIEKNIPKDLIISKLLGAGWHREDIDEGFSNIEKEVKQVISTPEIKKEEVISSTTSPVIPLAENKNVIVDKYHEPIEGDNIFEIEKQQQKIEAPIIEEKKAEVPAIDTHKTEVPIVEAPKIEPIKTETPKVWTPMSVPIKEKSKEEVVKVEMAKTTEIEVQNIELPAKKVENLSIPSKKDTINTNEEVIPTLIPKMVIRPFDSVNKNNQIKQDTPTISPEASTDSLVKNLPKIAMLSSYQNDLLSVNKTKAETVKKKSFKIIKWLIIILIILVVSLPVVWLLKSGYINIKNLNFIKKDPKVLLLNNSKILSSLKSYKTETNIEVSSPSFSDITYGLISGEAVSGNGKDTVSINTLGIINKNESGMLSDNFVTIKSSVLSNYITTDIKNNGSDLFIAVPDLSGIIKDNAPEPAVVKANSQQFELIPPLFSPNIEKYLNKINIYNILSSGIPSYINSETLASYNELVNNVEITEKGQENIKGVDTYHYSINVDRQIAKEFLTKISNNFILNLSDEDKDRLTQILGGVALDSFEVWVGKGDNNIYQYSVVVDIPLSKIIGFEDKSIGDNKINISWKTTYYDFEVANNILIPDTSISVIDFVKKIKETKMKNDVSSFAPLATALSNIEKSYGKKPNTSGNCMNPSSGSLFSPTGHSNNTKTTTAVSSISILLNKILGVTNGAGSCYSTTKAWSLAIPISDNYDTTAIPEGGYKSFYCIDSTGFSQDLTTLPTGVVCK